MNDRETALYRLYDEQGALLYVGISGRWLARLGQHAHEKGWWNDVAAIKRELLPSRAQALTAEVQAIRTEGPRHNILNVLTEKPAVSRTTKEEAPAAPMIHQIDQEAVADVVTDLMALYQAAYDEAAEIVGAMEDPLEAFKLTELLDKELQSLTHKSLTMMKARAAVRVQQTYGLSFAKLAESLGRSKAGVALLVRIGRSEAA